SDAPLAEELCLRLGRLCREADPEHAKVSYARVLEYNSLEAEALEALEALYDPAKEPARLAEVLTRRLDTTLDREEIIRLAVRLGDLYRVELKNLDGAVACYQRILSQDPQHADALLRLAEIHRERGESTELCEVLQKTFEAATTDPERM